MHQSTLLRGCSTLSQCQLRANPSRHPTRADITTVIAMARGKMSVTTTSMALSKWPVSKEARGYGREPEEQGR
jgi:hypothetical protein